MDRPNLLFVFADQWRAQAAGYAGDPNVRTPALDRFAAESVNCINAVSGCPVCSPYRASLLTGQHPLRTGMIVNDQFIRSYHVSFAEALAGAGYDTAYIGKWHINGPYRSLAVPREARMGFRYWRTCECTHDYNRSRYCDEDDRVHLWEGYDADAQTHQACRYLSKDRDAARPFALFLSWGPPHDPYDTAPERYRRLYDPATLHLRANVPADHQDRARKTLAGYYAHIAALDDCFAELLAELERCDLSRNTIVVFTSDHGDMHGSHGLWKKQHPHDESVLVPLLIRGPRLTARVARTPIGTPDLMPTLLNLCGADIPQTVDGDNLADVFAAGRERLDRSVLLACYMPFHELRKPQGSEYRGIRTIRHTYVRQLNGPTLLFDNAEDPSQLRNRADDPACAALRASLEEELQRHLRAQRDDFAPGEELYRRYAIRLNQHSDVFYAG